MKHKDLLNKAENLTDRAIKTLTKLLDCENESVRFRAAKELIDRAHGRTSEETRDDDPNRNKELTETLKEVLKNVRTDKRTEQPGNTD